MATPPAVLDGFVAGLAGVAGLSPLVGLAAVVTGGLLALAADGPLAGAARRALGLSLGGLAALGLYQSADGIHMLRVARKLSGSGRPADMPRTDSRVLTALCSLSCEPHRSFGIAALLAPFVAGA